MLNCRNKFFFEKSFTNISNLPSLESISLTFFNDDTVNILRFSSVLFLLTKKQPSFIYKKLSQKRKGSKELVGCNVKLVKSESRNFLFYLIINIFPRINNLKTLVDIKPPSSKSFSLTINDLFVFPEISRELNKFYGLKNLNMTFNFKSGPGVIDLKRLITFPSI